MKFFSKSSIRDQFGGKPATIEQAIATGDIAAMARFAEEARAQGQRLSATVDRAVDPRTINGI